jgi:putative ABC transport system substrate-binding protein
LRIAALALNVGIELVAIENPDDFHDAFLAMRQKRADALVIVQGRSTALHRIRLIELANKNRLPSMCEASSWTRASCLMSYGPDQTYQWRRAATFVDSILKGANPGDLPVEQPTKLELVVNLKTAKALGVTIPQSILLRADEVIE